MLQNTKDLYGDKLATLDGDIGHVKDFYFDDKIWVIRYLVVDTGSWLTGRLVLLSPHALGPREPSAKTLRVTLHKDQIKNSPSIESHRPVSRQYEIEYYRYYGWPAYWDGSAMWGLGSFPVVLPPSKEQMEARQHPHYREDKHLQSARAVTGYHLQAADDTVGHVTGFLVDDKSWAIHQLVVEAGHWYSGKEVLIPTSNVERISYEDSKVFVNLTKAEIQHLAENTLEKAETNHPRR